MISRRTRQPETKPNGTSYRPGEGIGEPQALAMAGAPASGAIANAATGSARALHLPPVPGPPGIQRQSVLSGGSGDLQGLGLRREHTRVIMPSVGEGLSGVQEGRNRRNKRPVSGILDRLSWPFSWVKE